MKIERSQASASKLLRNCEGVDDAKVVRDLRFSEVLQHGETGWNTYGVATVAKRKS
jgi:hypothetical protein